MWCVGELDEEYIARMEEVLGLYEKPLCERAPVVCIDEKPVMLHADIHSPIAMEPEELPGGTMNTSVAEPPTCFAGSSPRRDGTSPR